MQAAHKAFLVVLLQSCLLGAALGADPWPFTKQPWNIKGDVLILDVGSLSFQGNHPISPPLNEDSCADACARTPGCNAWTFCGNKDGCGSGCAAYTAQKPQLKPASGPNDNPTVPNPAWKSLPSITGFGPWGLTANCKYVCTDSGCKPGDKWPYGMCTLKKIASPDKPEFWWNNAGEGFVSGFAKQPPECAALPIRTCTRCSRSRDPASCLKCATNPAFRLSMLEGATSSSLTKADGCSSCIDSTAPGKCVECLTSGAPCAECALQAPVEGSRAAFDVSACVDCTSKHGERLKASCVACASLAGSSSGGGNSRGSGNSGNNIRGGNAGAQAMGQCMACLDTLKPLACDKTDYQSGCWNPTIASFACATCASRVQSFGTCVACLKASPFSGNCEACASLEGSKQEACYSCSKAARHPSSGCADCLSYLSDTRQQQQCVGCMTNPKVGAEGKQWCFGCQNWCTTFDSRAQCVACLGTPQDAYMQACACK